VRLISSWDRPGRRAEEDREREGPAQDPGPLRRRAMQPGDPELSRHDLEKSHAINNKLKKKKEKKGTHTASAACLTRKEILRAQLASTSCRCQWMRVDDPAVLASLDRANDESVGQLSVNRRPTRVGTAFALRPPRACPGPALAMVNRMHSIPRYVLLPDAVGKNPSRHGPSCV